LADDKKSRTILFGKVGGSTITQTVAMGSEVEGTGFEFEKVEELMGVEGAAGAPPIGLVKKRGKTRDIKR